MSKKLAPSNIAYGDWTETRLTLHIILQIIGKTRLKTTPRKNHWWYITLYVSNQGFRTGDIPFKQGLESFEIEYNVRRKAVVFSFSSREEIVLSLAGSPSIAQFYADYMQNLKDLGIHPEFVAAPFDLSVTKAFEEITELHHYDWPYIEKCWKLMLWNKHIFEEFSGRFYGKSCPVHIYWHHLDLVVTRFSGKKLPAMDAAARTLEKDSYSHEQISFGFWIGDDNTPEPMYYSYTYPAPAGMDQEPLLPANASWQNSNGSPMALLRYQDVLESDNPHNAVLDFLESAYRAGATRAGWPIAELEVPSLNNL